MFEQNAEITLKDIQSPFLINKSSLQNDNPKHMILKRFFILMFWVITTNTLLAQNLFDLNHTTQFAQYLYKTHQYEQAAEELERALFIAPGVDSLQGLLLSSYQLSGNHQKGHALVARLYPDISQVPFYTAEAYLNLLINEKQWQQASSFIAQNKLISEDTKKIYEINLAFHLYSLKDLDKLFQKNDTLTFSALPKYRQLYSSLRTTKLKSPLAAGVLSAILPGAGKLYAKDTKDGIISMVFVSLMGYQTYRAYQKKGWNQNNYFYLYGGLTLAFYSGNIYGSVKSARRYNKEVKSAYGDQAQTITSELIR